MFREPDLDRRPAPAPASASAAPDPGPDPDPGPNDCDPDPDPNPGLDPNLDLDLDPSPDLDLEPAVSGPAPESDRDRDREATVFGRVVLLFPNESAPTATISFRSGWCFQARLFRRLELIFQNDKSLAERRRAHISTSPLKPWEGVARARLRPGAERGQVSSR